MKLINKGVYFSLIVAGASAFAAQVPVSDISSGSGSNDSQRLATLERILQASSERQLQVQQQLDALLDEVNQLRGETEVHSHKLEQLVERQRELYQELETRFSKLQTNQQAQAATVLLDSTTTSSDTTASISTPEVVYSDDVGENEAYDKAMNLVLKERKYDQAIPEFEAFIQRFPDSEYAPNAYYWLGQLLFNKGNYTKAKAPFERVVNFYPDSNKRSDAIYKLGSIAFKTNNKPDAKALFERVISEYPGSTPAKLATSRLKNLQ